MGWMWRLVIVFLGLPLLLVVSIGSNAGGGGVSSGEYPSLGPTSHPLCIAIMAAANVAAVVSVIFLFPI